MSGDVDVIVVGAGLAGLTTARHLALGGASVLVLEANDRVGGRTLSQSIGKGVFDLGGQWIGPTQRRMRRLVDELSLRTFRTHTEGERLFVQDGRRATYRGTIPPLPLHTLLTVHAAFRAIEQRRLLVPTASPERAGSAASWDSMTLATWARRRIPFAAARDAFAAACRVVFGAELAELSLLHFLFYVNAAGGIEPLLEVEGGAQETRFLEGAQEISRRLAERLGDGRVVLSTPVLAIDQSGPTVVVRTLRGDYGARRVVVAVPPAIASRIAFHPALPADRDQLTQRVPMGSTIKAIALYDEPFWRRAGLSGECVFTSGPVSVIFDNTSGEQASLLGFLVGHNAREWGARPAADRRRAVLSSFVQAFGPAAAEPTSYLEKDWSTEPYIRGCPVGSPTLGTLTSVGHALRASIGKLHFAGTETALEWNGYMDGAVESGERVATEVLAHLR
jgi:monoamine oxidase